MERKLNLFNLISVKKFKLFKYNKRSKKKIIGSNVKVSIKKIDKKLLKIVPKNLQVYIKDLRNNSKLFILSKNKKIYHFSYVLLGSKDSGDPFVCMHSQNFKTKKKQREITIGPTYTYKKFRNKGLYSIALNRIINQFYKNYDLFISTEKREENSYKALKINNFVCLACGYRIDFLRVIRVYLYINKKKFTIKFSCHLGFGNCNNKLIHSFNVC